MPVVSATDPAPAGIDTIFAPASGQGRAAVAIVRLSGPGCGMVLDRLAGGRPPLRRAALRRLLDPADGTVIDQALVLWMPGPASFTGEDQAELHVHGGPAVRAAILRVLSGLPGLRLAEPGEFARRAFLNGRMDLSGAEGLADLIDAETEAQRRQALRQMEGALALRVAGWCERLLDAAALLAASFDFSDEDDVREDVARGLAADLAALSGEIGTELAGARQGERLRDGCTIVIAGPANAGKSTLLNALARRDVAIVSPQAGTTRDAIEVRCDLDGWPVTFVDTAGLRETTDALEREGVERARSRAACADLVLWLVPAGASDTSAPSGLGPILRVTTKADLASRTGEATSISPPDRGVGVGEPLAISALTGSGLTTLLDAIRSALELGSGGDALVTRERHRVALAEVVEAIGRAGTALAGGHEELAAEDVRLALRALGRITGAVDVEMVLDRVFSQFCIGK